MIGIERDQSVDRLLPLRHSLLRQPHHQVDAHVVEASLTNLAHRLTRPRAAVGPSKPPQLFIDQRLDPQAHAVDAGVPEPAHPLDRDGLGVRLERHLRVGSHVERLPARGNQRGDLLGFQQRRRPATEEDRVGCTSVRGPPNLRLEGTGVLPLQLGVEQTAVEVAVAAD